MKKRRLLSMILALAMLALAMSSLTACGGKTETTASENDAEFLEYLKNASYPLETDKVLTCWSYRGGTTYGEYEADELPYLKNYEEKTGVKVEWTFANTDVKQQFNLLVASGDFPDMVSYMWGVSADFPGGPERAIADGYISTLDELIPVYAPDINAYLEGNDIARRELKTDSGNYYYIPNYVTTKEVNGAVSNGYVFRKDWLDDLGLDLPETIDDWYTTLKAFKEKKGAEAPLSLQYSALTRGITNPFDVSGGLFIKDGKVTHGAVEPGYLEFLKEMNKWFNEGILDRNIATIDAKAVNANILNNKSGATHYWMSGMRNALIAGREKDPNFDLAGVQFPVKNKGDMPKFGTRDAMIYNSGFAISKNSANKELAMKLLNYGYTTEGRELMLFGIEGETYTIENGEYKYTELITNNPDGLSLNEAKAAYIRNTENIPIVSGYHDLRASYVAKDPYPEVDAAIEIWKKNNKDGVSFSNSIAPGPDETSEYAKLQTEITTYVSEMNLKFLVGEEPFENYDKYQAELKKRGMDRYLEIAQKSYDRYIAR